MWARKTITMKRIFKYRLETTDEQTIAMPKGAEILSLQAQNGIPCIWAMVDASEPVKVNRYFEIIGTGHPINGDAQGKFIGTYQLMGGLQVYHVFERI